MLTAVVLGLKAYTINLFDPPQDLVVLPVHAILQPRAKGSSFPELGADNEVRFTAVKKPP